MKTGSLQSRLPYLLVVIFILLCAPPSYARVLAIKAGQMFNAETGEMLREQTILIEDGKIKEFGSQIKIPSSAEIIDLSKKNCSPRIDRLPYPPDRH
jgi:hypothetical protein